MKTAKLVEIIFLVFLLALAVVTVIQKKELSTVLLIGLSIYTGYDITKRYPE